MNRRRWHKANVKGKMKNSKLNFELCSLIFRFALVLVLVVMLFPFIQPATPAFAAPAVDQTHYRWRNDDGGETGSWTVDGVAYTTRRMLMIDDTKIDADLTEFPVRVSLASFPGIDLANFNSDGNDIRFTKFDGTTLLKYERESFNQTADTGEVWVKIPNVRDAAGDDNRFFIYYRTTDTADGADPTNVWDTNYKAVYHLNTASQGTVATDCYYYSDTFSRAMVRTDDDNKTIHVFLAKGSSGDNMGLWWKKSTDDGVTWTETQIGTNNGKASLTTATVDPTNGKDIHMSYCYHSSHSINEHWMFYRKLSWNAGNKNWDIGSEETVNTEAGTETSDSSLVVDSAGVVHLVFLYSNGTTTNRLYYENNSAGNWNASPTTLASDTSWIVGVIELDSSRNLHVVATNNNFIRWRKATYSAGPTWTWAASWTSISATFTYAWSHVNASMDASDRLHVAWGGYATTPYPLNYRRKNANDTWETTITIDSGNNHCYTEVAAYGDRVYVTATYNSGTGQAVYYKSTNAGASFGSRMAISPTTPYNYRFQSRISKYGVRPVFEGAWAQNSAQPFTIKYVLIDELDSTTNDNDGSCVNGVVGKAAGKINSADTFDGTDDYIDRGTGPTSVQTVDFWVYPQTTTEYFVNVTSTTDYIWVNAGTVTATGFITPTIYVNGAATTTLVAGQWQHVAVTTGTAENASNLDIGRTADANYLQGTIDEVRISATARTAAWIKADYNSGNNSLLTYGSQETGTGTAATWKAAEDAEVTGQARVVNVRVRFSIKNTGDAASNYNYRLQVSESESSGFTDVPTQTGGPGCSAACMTTSANFVNQSATTRQLSWPGSLAWTAGKIVEDNSNQTDAITLANNSFTEVEFNFKFTSNAKSNTTYYFRVVNATTPLGSYTNVAKTTTTTIPSWDSYKTNYGDSGGFQCDTFADFQTEHQVYMYGTGYTASTPYEVIYWDGATKRMVESGVQSDGTGKLKSTWIFNPEQATENDWHVTSYTDSANPSTYSTLESTIVSDDITYGCGYGFHLAQSAIPEFPTIFAGIGVAGLCFGIYWWMRRKSLKFKMQSAN